jgi:hypothetical protein
MAEGYESYTETGKLQFNSDMFTYALQSSGQVVAENRKVGNTSPQSILLPSSYPGKIVALAGPNGHSAGYAGLYYLNPGDTRRVYATNSPAGTVWQYYVFSLSVDLPASNFGIEVRNAANQITFSSNYRTMRVLDIVGAGVANATYPGKTLAFAQGQWSGHRIAGQKQYYGGGSGPGTIGPQVPDTTGEGPPSGAVYSSYINDGKIYGGTNANDRQTVVGATLSWDDVTIGPALDSPAPPDFTIGLKLFVIDVTGFPLNGTFF